MKKVDVVVNSTMDFSIPLLDITAYKNVSEALEKAGGKKKKVIIATKIFL